MLLGSFYHIVSSSNHDSQINARIELNAEHDIFKGHFPDKPLVPGVCQIQMMEEVASQLLGKRLQVKHATQIKFISFVNPLENKLLDINIKIERVENDLLYVETNYIWGETIYFKFKGELNEC